MSLETSWLLVAFFTESVRSCPSFETFYSEAHRFKGITDGESPKAYQNPSEQDGLEEMI